jgi:hypothetical protein
MQATIGINQQNRESRLQTKCIFVCCELIDRSIGCLRKQKVKRRVFMKTVLALAAAAVVATTAVADAASASRNAQQQHNVGWASRQHVYAADHYTPWYDSYGNTNPDFQLVH